jgi:hypothetical protein
MIALPSPDQRHVGRPVVTDFLKHDVELDDLDVLGVSRRQAKMHNPIEPGGYQKHDVGVQGQGARRETDNGWSSGTTPLTHQRTQERDL